MQITNRVAASDIVVFDPATLVPAEAPVEIDLAPLLHRGMVLREKEFRAQVEAIDVVPLQGRDVALFCSSDAVVPTWAWMLMASKLAGAASVTQGRAVDALRERIALAAGAVDWTQFAGRPVVVKGCGNSVPPAAYTAALRALQGVASKVMYGEPCSAVPVWRAPKPAAATNAGSSVKPARPPGR
jgi:hypothetical protein